MGFLVAILECRGRLSLASTIRLSCATANALPSQVALTRSIVQRPQLLAERSIAHGKALPFRDVPPRVVWPLPRDGARLVNCAPMPSYDVRQLSWT